MCYPQQLGRSWKVFVPEPSRTLFAMCTGTLRNLISHRRNCIRNLISFLHRNPLELSGTLRNLLRNLGLQLHRIAPELFWAKDPIASFAVGEKHGFLGELNRQLHMAERFGPSLPKKWSSPWRSLEANVRFELAIT